MILGPEQSLPLIDIPAPSELGFGSVTVTGAADYAILTSDYATHGKVLPFRLIGCIQTLYYRVVDLPTTIS